MSKNTPGPWTFIVGTATTLKEIFIGPDDGITIDPICRLPLQNEFKPNQNANAKLIAAAPELLEACQEGHDLLRDICNASGNNQPYTMDELDKICSDIIEQMDKAIQKAGAE